MPTRALPRSWARPPWRSTGTRSTSKQVSFGPARDGFGFRNPVGWVPDRTGGEEVLRRSSAFVYGKGLCFGMAAAVLLSFHTMARSHPPLAELPLTRKLLAVLQEHQFRQFYTRTMLMTVWDWISSGGGKPEGVLGQVRLVGASQDPHILCFGPAPSRRFFSCLAQTHAVVPYRIEEGRIYVYDPNYPCDRERFVEFLRYGAEFVYDGFHSREGWGITLVPISACLDRRRNVSTQNRVEWTQTSTRAQTEAGGTNGRG